MHSSNVSCLHMTSNSSLPDFEHHLGYVLSMQGEYEFQVWDQDVEDWAETIRVSVGRFGLVVVEENVVEDA